MTQMALGVCGMEMKEDEREKSEGGGGVVFFFSSQRRQTELWRVPLARRSVKKTMVAVPCDFRVKETSGQLPDDDPQSGVQRADTLLKQLPRRQWTAIRWREGTKGGLRKKFVSLRVWRVLEGKCLTQGWLIGERPSNGQQGEWKYYFSDFPPDAPLRQMVGYVHQRWQIDRFYQDAKQLLGWGDYQGRKWIGFHRHTILVMLTDSFLVTQEFRQRHHRLRG